MVVHASVELRHPGCVSERFHGATVLTQVSADRGSDVFVLQAADATALDQALRWCEEYAKNKAGMIGRTATCAVFRGINTPGGTIAAVRASECSILWPVTYRDGLEHFTILAPDRDALRRLVDALAPVAEVREVRLHEVAPEGLEVGLPMSDLTASLTPRQLKVFELAMRQGYYRIPRRTTTGALAEAFGVSRSTFGEHLRKAEDRILERVAAALDTRGGLRAGAKRGRGRPKGFKVPSAKTEKR